MRGTLHVAAGHDRDAILAHIVSAVREHVATLTLGRDVLHSDLVVLIRRTPGVFDVQKLHLRRCPAIFGQVNLGGAQFRQTVELGPGENVALAPDEIPYFRIDSRLVDMEVVER
jgi:hypothetical protein